MTTPQRAGGNQLLLVTLVAATGGFLFGYDTAVINGANQYLKGHFGLNPLQEGMAGASAILGCIPGAMCAGFLSDRFGRRKVLFLCALLYAVSGVLSAIPQTFYQFLAARFISGLGIGASSMICPVYIAEIAPKERRGRLGSLFQLGIVIGIFLTLFINAQIQGMGDPAWNAAQGWRWMLGAEVAPAMLLLGLLFFVPESPRWLIQAGREAEARQILEGVGGAAHAETEIAAVRSVLGEEEGRFSELFHARFRRPLIIAVLLMMFSQFSGINAIMYYSTTIFTTAGVGVKDSFTASALIGAVNVILGLLFYLGYTGVALLAGIVGFIAAFAMALGPIPWILCSEIFPTKVRGRAMSLATFTIWTSCYIVAQTCPMLLKLKSDLKPPQTFMDHLAHFLAIGPANTFWVYAACSLLGLLFVFVLVPETKGRSLEEIERSWADRPA
jgi:SP family arabinose:H+ symporter-like MFS transporter